MSTGSADVRPPRRERKAGSGPARLAAEIRHIRRQISPDALRSPQVSLELSELFKVVAAEPEPGGGRHRLRAGDSPRRPGQGAAATPVGDASGFDLKPDPLGARTPAELVSFLRAYREWSGDPSYRRMAAQARQRVAHSTMYGALHTTDLPRLPVVVAIVAGCGGGEDDQRAFATAWRRVKSTYRAPESGY